MKSIKQIIISLLKVVLISLISLIPFGSIIYGMEKDTDRPGMDYKNFDLPSPDPNHCQNACINDPQCKAFTYVKPGIQGINARCWLKTGVPALKQSTCCISGIKKADAGAPSVAPVPMQPGLSVITPAAGFESDTNRPGMDYRSFDLSDPRPELCRQACEQEHQCKSFTYVKPGAQGPSARCWLKSGVPASVNSSCCISGVKASKEEITPIPIPGPKAEEITPIPLPGPKSPSLKDSLPVPIPAPQLQPGSKLISPPAPGPRLQQFQFAMANQLKALNLRERQLEDASIEKVRRDIQALSTTGAQSQMKPGVATKACSTPQITSVYPTTVKPGGIILIQGCGFPAYPDVMLYDPTGDILAQLTSSNAVKLLAKKSSSTFIEVEVPKVKQGMAPLQGPRQVFIRVRDSATKQYGNPSQPINLQPNMEIYVCRQGECLPHNIEKNGTQVMVRQALDYTAEVYHLVSPKESETKGTYVSDFKGIDVLFENLKMPQWWKLVEFGFSYEHICYDKQTDSYKSCVHNPKVKLEQDLSKIDGQTLLPRASVYWEARSTMFDNVGVAYIYVLYVRGPEGWPSIPF